MLRRASQRVLDDTTSMAICRSRSGFGRLRLRSAPEEPFPKLNLLVLEGDGALNTIAARTTCRHIVQIKTANHTPGAHRPESGKPKDKMLRSEEHTSELQ